jgi:hypothetical protein
MLSVDSLGIDILYLLFTRIVLDILRSFKLLQKNEK